MVALFNSYNMDPITASAIIAGTAGVAGAGASFFGAQATNAANQRINSQNMWYDAYKTVYQNKWQKYMYDYSFDKENEYNSPAAQMQRYREAGLNPYMMMQGQSAVGAGGTTMSSATGGTPQQLQMQNPYSGFGQILSSTGSDVASALLQGVQATNAINVGNSQIRLNNSNADAIDAGISGIKSENSRKAADARVSEVNAENAEVLQSYSQAAQREEYARLKLQNDVVRLQLPFIPQKEMLGLAKVFAEVQQIYTNIELGRLTGEQIKAETSRIKELVNGLQIDNALKKYTPDQVKLLINSHVLSTYSGAVNEWHKAVKGNPQSAPSQFVTDIVHLFSPEHREEFRYGFPLLPEFDRDKAYKSIWSY